jgi:hypothetical protein
VSHPLTARRPLPRRTRIIALALIVAAGALAVAGATGVIPSMRVALTALSNLDLPRWVHSLADLLQILTAVIAFMVWEGTRRVRR